MLLWRAVFALPANAGAEAPPKARLACSSYPQPCIPRAHGAWRGEWSLLHSMLQASQGRFLLWCICLLTLGMVQRQPAPQESQGTPVPRAQAWSKPLCCGRARQPPAVASQLPAPSSLPAAPGWGWGCGGVSQSRMPIWNPLGTFNPPHPFWCCLSSPPPTHTTLPFKQLI